MTLRLNDLWPSRSRHHSRSRVAGQQLSTRRKYRLKSLPAASMASPIRGFFARPAPNNFPKRWDNRNPGLMHRYGPRRSLWSCKRPAVKSEVALFAAERSDTHGGENQSFDNPGPPRFVNSLACTFRANNHFDSPLPLQLLRFSSSSARKYSPSVSF